MLFCATLSSMSALLSVMFLLLLFLSIFCFFISLLLLVSSSCCLLAFVAVDVGCVYLSLGSSLRFRFVRAIACSVSDYCSCFPPLLVFCSIPPGSPPSHCWFCLYFFSALITGCFDVVFFPLIVSSSASFPLPFVCCVCCSVCCSFSGSSGYFSSCFFSLAPLVFSSCLMLSVIVRPSCTGCSTPRCSSP